MRLATFWEQLERNARPHVEQDLAKLGWVLKEGTAHRWRAERVKGSLADGTRLAGDTIQRTSASALLEVIRRRELAMRLGPVELLDFDEAEGLFP